MRDLPKGGTFHHAILSLVPTESWPGLVGEAIELFGQNRKNEAAESVFQYASMQAVESLRPHLGVLFELAPNSGTYYETWPWRGADNRAVEQLLAIVKEESKSPQVRRRAWMCLLQTRAESILRVAIEHVRHVDLNLQMRQWGLPASLDITTYLHEVGFERSGTGFRMLYADDVHHISFPPEFFSDNRPSWLRRENHPTWNLPPIIQGQRIRFGGEGASRCGRCRKPAHSLVSFESLDCLPSVSGLSSLHLETCLSCLGWEEPRMFYRHDADGRPICLSVAGSPPQFPAVQLKETEAYLVDCGSRWQWQSWGASNSRENLNRVGGHPTWVQSAEFPQCPDCNATMVFLLQLDSDLPTGDKGEWLWGSGGIAYAFWCDSCKISGILWQCT